MLTGKVNPESASSSSHTGGGAFRYVRLRKAAPTGKHPRMNTVRRFLHAADPIHLLRATLTVLGKALTRLWGRDVMLYVGGVSFFALLAVFPGLALSIGLYGVFLSPERAALEAEQLARAMPVGARSLFQDELQRLAHTPLSTIWSQNGFALVIGAYAAHRGFKALLAGLTFIHEEEEQRGFFGFNLMALIVLISAFVLLAVASGVFLFFRLLASTLDLRPLAGVSWFFSEWTWASVAVTLAMTLIYRYAMSRKPTPWGASVMGGISASLLCLFASWASAFYVEKVVSLGATYGSVAAIIVFLIWLSWNVNAIFFGGALATETEIALAEQASFKAGPAEN
jgi:membrane protein